MPVLVALSYAARALCLRVRNQTLVRQLRNSHVDHSCEQWPVQFISMN
jgi:hypothetical protein